MSGEIRSQGSEVFIVDPSATGSEIIKIGNITNRGALGGEPARIPTTNLDSTIQTSMSGLPGEERFQLTINLGAGNEAHEFLEDNAGSTTVYQVLVCDSTGASPPTYVSSAVVFPTNRNTRHFTARIGTFQIQAVSTDAVETVNVGFDLQSKPVVVRKTP